MSGVWGVSTTRDEDDILEASTRHALEEFDHVLIEDHCSTDGTAEILARLAAEFPTLHLLSDPDPAFQEVAKLNELMGRATARGATWVVPFDTDEVWCSAQGRLRDVLHGLSGDYVRATVWEHVPSATSSLNPLASMVLRRSVPWHWGKVAIRCGRGLLLSVGHHEVSGPGSEAAERMTVHHFPYRSPEQVRRRVARNALAATGAGNEWNYRGLEQEFHDPAVLAEWWSGLTSEEGTVYDPAPLRG